MSNPLLESLPLPSFSRIEPAHVRPAIEHLIEENRKAIRERLEQGGRIAGKIWLSLWKRWMTA